MRIIVTLNSKGGVGKSTITRHLAVAAVQEDPWRVAICDTDPQGSLADWWNARHWSFPTLISAGLTQFRHHREDLADRFNYLFIDTASASSKEYKDILPIADLVVIPVLPGADDLRSLMKLTMPVVGPTGQNYLFVINNTRPGTPYLATMLEELSVQGEVCPTIIQRRTGHFKASLSGSTILEDAPKSKGAQEIRDLWEYVKKVIDRSEASDIAIKELLNG